MHSNVCFNVLTYATPYKQFFVKTVAWAPSDKAPEEEKGECEATRDEAETERERGESRGKVRSEPKKISPLSKLKQPNKSHLSEEVLWLFV